MGTVAAHSNPWMNRFKGISPVLDFAEGINYLPTVLFQKTYELSSTGYYFKGYVPSSGQQTLDQNDLVSKRTGYDFVDATRPYFINIASHELENFVTLMVVVARVAKYVFAILATATVVLPLAGLAIKACYVGKIRRLQEATEQLNNPTPAQSRDLFKHFKIIQDDIFNILNDIPPQDARFDSDAFTVKAEFQEVIMEEAERARRLGQVAADPEVLKNIIADVERAWNAKKKEEDRLRAEGGVSSSKSTTDMMTANDFAKLRMKMDRIYKYLQLGRNDQEVLAYVKSMNYGLDGAVIKFDGLDYVVSNSLGEIRDLYENFRIIMSFMKQDDIKLDLKIVALKQLRDALDACSPTWVSQAINIIRQLNNPNKKLGDTVEAAQEELRGMFHDSIVNFIEAAVYDIPYATVNILDGFIAEHGARYGYTKDQVDIAERAPHRKKLYNNTIKSNFQKRCLPNQIIKMFLEELATKDYTTGRGIMLYQAVEKLAEDGQLKALLKEVPAFKFDEKKDKFEDVDLTMVTGAFYANKSSSEKHPIPRRVVIQVLRDLGIFINF